MPGLAPLLLWTVLASAAAAQQGPTADAGFARQALAGCPTDLQWLNQISGWQVRWTTTLESVSVETEARRTALEQGWRSAPDALAAAVDSLRSGLELDRAAPAVVVRRVLGQIDELLAAPDSLSPLLSPARRSTDVSFGTRWRALVTDELEPAIRAYREFVRGEYLPRAPEAPGLARLPEGTGCFREAIEGWTGMSVDGAEVERIGRQRLVELERELLDLARPDYGATLSEVVGHLREGRFPDAFGSRQDVVDHAGAAIARARAAVPDWFATPGDLDVTVVPIPRSLEASFPAGLYRSPSGPGEAATYMVNTSHPRHRRLLSEVVAFHEAIPGHHTSFAVPAAAGSSGGRFNSAFAEGWAIYAERLADEMGLYSSRLDRAGLVAKHLWAASRLVVEPGIHIHGWSRERAVAFMLEHTTLSRSEIELEVDRYIGLPGQSLAYMLGYLEFRRIRTEAEERLGRSFDIRAFHDVVLRPGIRPLADVARDVEQWSSRASAGTSRSALTISPNHGRSRRMCHMPPRDGFQRGSRIPARQPLVTRARLLVPPPYGHLRAVRIVGSYPQRERMTCDAVSR